MNQGPSRAYYQPFRVRKSLLVLESSLRSSSAILLQGDEHG